jgi:hypothetical protein
MGNLGNCIWPNCSCDTENGEPCKFDDPDFYINKARNIENKNKRYRKANRNKLPAYSYVWLCLAPNGIPTSGPVVIPETDWSPQAGIGDHIARYKAMNYVCHRYTYTLETIDDSENDGDDD